MYAEPYREPRGRPPPKKKRSFVSDILPALLVVVLAMAGVHYFQTHRTRASVALAAPPGMDSILPVGAAQDLGSDGWVLYPLATWTPPSDPDGIATLCNRITKHLGLHEPQTVDITSPEGDTLARCIAD